MIIFSDPKFVLQSTEAKPPEDQKLFRPILSNFLTDERHMSDGEMGCVVDLFQLALHGLWDYLTDETNKHEITNNLNGWVELITKEVERFESQIRMS